MHYFRKNITEFKFHQEYSANGTLIAICQTLNVKYTPYETHIADFALRHQRTCA